MRPIGPKITLVKEKERKIERARAERKKEKQKRKRKKAVIGTLSLHWLL